MTGAGRDLPLLSVRASPLGRGAATGFCAEVVAVDGLDAGFAMFGLGITPDACECGGGHAEVLDGGCVGP